MYQITDRGTLWTLHKNGKTARAVVREIEGVGLELRYYWDAELMQSFLFKDGTDLLKEAQIKPDSSAAGTKADTREQNTAGEVIENQ
jgi:hypothetical protein